MLIVHREKDIKRIFEERINDNQIFSEFSKTQGDKPQETQERINHNQIFSEFSKRKAIKLKKLAIVFKIQSISILAKCSAQDT